MNRLLISAAHKSSGKTTITIGLCAALRRRGHAVQPFKKGPDYIDPMWLALAAGRDCHNLDFYLMPHAEILDTFETRSRGADLAIIEGNKGLYDGLDLDGSNSNAALATLLLAPVVLVIDARGMTRGIAPLILGYQAFDRNVRIAGVILNRLGGSRHESKLRAVIEHYTDVPVLGAVHEDARLEIVERHLGLMPSNENREAQARIAAIAERVAGQVDLDRLLAVAASAAPLPVQVKAKAGKEPSPSFPLPGPRPFPSPAGAGEVELVNIPAPDREGSRPSAPRATAVRIGIARDEAFGFYYPGDLEALQAAGAELVPVNTLRDPRLPDVDGLFIGGGFPEMRLQELSRNRSLREDIRAAIENGLPAYAECGGLMYLSRAIRWNDERAEMVGVIPAETVMEKRPQGRGYVRLRETGAGPWPVADTAGRHADIAAHEFHYSRLEGLPPGQTWAYEVLRGFGTDGQHDGLVHRNLLACYCHQRHLASNPWARRFVDFIRSRKAARA
jgi:cobyrinic acid a,c-diamide synthase